MSDLGIRLAPGSRLDQMCKTLETQGVIPREAPNFETALQGVKDVQEFVFIVRELGSNLEINDRRRRITRALKDAELPDPDREGSPGRDLQTELLVEATLQNAGASPELHDPPDYRAYVAEDLPFWVEVKRVKCAARLEERFEEAFDRLGEAGGIGVAVVDVSFAHNPENLRVDRPLSDRQITSLWVALLTRFSDEWQPKLIRLRGKRSIRGVLILDSFVRAVADGKWSLETMTWGIPLDRHHAARRAEFSAIEKMYGRGLPTAGRDPRLT